MILVIYNSSFIFFIIISQSETFALTFDLKDLYRVENELFGTRKQQKKSIIWAAFP